MQMKVDGLEELRRALGKKPELLKSDLRRIVSDNTMRLHREAVKNAHFGRYTKKPNGYTTGNLRSSISSKMSTDGLFGEVSPHTEYASYVEYGTRKMQAQPYMRPAFKKIKPKFINDIKKLAD